MYTYLIFRAIIVGFIASIPIGPIALLVIQKSISGGRKEGMICASGATLVDTLFATISLFAFSAISGFIDANAKVIELVGGMVVVLVGITMSFSKPTDHKDRSTHIKPRHLKSKIALDVFKSTMMGLTNPGAFAVMLALFTTFNIDNSAAPAYITYLIILGVAGGSLLYWFPFTWLAAKGHKLKMDTLVKINQLSGIAVVVFGIWLIIAGIFK